jgi:hypothetical protein
LGGRWTGGIALFTSYEKKNAVPNPSNKEGIEFLRPEEVKFVV